MSEELKEHYKQKDDAFWDCYSIPFVVITANDALDYAEKKDSKNFFALLHDSAGVGMDLDDLIDNYAEDNRENIEEFMETV